MAVVDITYSPSWQTMLLALNSARFRALLVKHVGPATGKLAHVIQKEIRGTIKKKKFAPNAKLTALIKRSTLPLVDHGDLFKAIAVTDRTWDHAFIGIPRSSPSYMPALVSHNGKLIPVTPKMRNLFHILWVASEAKRNGTPMPILTGRAKELFARFQDWRPLAEATRLIKIPPRPFVAEAFRSGALLLYIKENYGKAVAAAFQEMWRL